VPDAVAEVARLYSGQAGPAEASRPWLRANMVSSTDGAASLAGRSGGLSGPADRMVFTVLRSLADVILVGAGTARAERYRPASAAGIWTGLRPAGAALPVIAVVTASLDLDSCSDLVTGDPPAIIVTSAAAAAAHAGRGGPLAGRAPIVVAGQQRVDVRQAVTALADLGYRQILVEGGPMLLGELAAADVLDEFCITFSPLLADGAAGRVVAPSTDCFAPGVATRLTLAHVLTDDGYLMCRYLRDQAPESTKE
jgi:5-amino-6-(5-phosphoribosylamino)uracil reductase